MTQWDYYMSGFWPGYYGPHKGKGAVAHWGNPYLGKGPKGQGSGKSKGKGKGDSPEAKGGEPEPAQVLSQNKGLQNTVEQLREANKKLKQAAAEQKVGQNAPPPKTVATPPAQVDTKAAWKCQSCGLDHHNGGLKQCRTCAAPRLELQAATPSPPVATVTTRYWGPVHDKASQRVFRRLPDASGLLLAASSGQPGTDEAMEPSPVEQQRLRDNAAATVAFLESQTPVDDGLLKTAKAKLEALVAKPLEKPDQDRGLVLVILDKQRLFNAQEAVKDQALLDASAERMLAAQEAHSAVGSQLAAAAAQRDKILADLTAALKTVEGQCFFECQEKEAAATLAPTPKLTATRQEAVGMLEWLHQLSGGGGTPPPHCATLLNRLQLLAGGSATLVVDDEEDGGAQPNTPLVLPHSPTPLAEGAEEDLSSAGATAEARAALALQQEQTAATKGANKGPHPLGKGTAAGASTPY